MFSADGGLSEFSFESTYEELKQKLAAKAGADVRSFESTYEELKLNIECEASDIGIEF